MKKVLFLAASFFAATGTVLSQGPNEAFDLSANAVAKNHIDMGDLPIGETDFTLEFWYRAGGVAGDPAIFSNKNWDSGTNTGLNIAIQGGGNNMDINFKSEEGERVDLNITSIDFTSRWHLVSLTFDRDGEMMAYVNGILQVTEDISVSPGTIASENTFKLGQDGTGSYGGQDQGQFDEVRIWSDLRTESEIRNNMSTRLTGAEEDLILYYTFDEETDENVTSLTGAYHGEIIEFVADNRSYSGAAIGDEVTTIYSEEWDGAEFVLSSPTGTCTINGFTGELLGLQFYRIDGAPNSDDGIYNLYGNDNYFGVYLIEGESVSYDLKYEYASFEEALTHEAEVYLANRQGNSYMTWFNADATVDYDEDEMNLNYSNSAEFILGFDYLGEPEPVDDYLGAGMSLDFNGTNNWVDLSNGKVSAASLNLPVDSITVEVWVNPKTFNTWNAAVGFLQDNGSFERGWDIETRDGNKFAFALATDGALTYLETESSFVVDRWYHVVGTYDGSIQKIYVNGHLEAETEINSGPIDYADSWLAVGAYKDDNEEVHLNAEIDEVRIWNEVRNPEEIRDMMCEKLDPSTDNLVAYYQFDEIEGLEVVDVSGHIANGTMTDMMIDRRVESGAPVGDESVHLYDVDWTSEELNLTLVGNGELTVKVLEENPYGVHIYRVEGAPITPDEFPLIESTAGYFGVFIAEEDEQELAKYKYEWDYTEFSEAESVEDDLLVIQRPSKVAEIWSINDASIEVLENEVIGDTMAYRTEVILSTNIGVTCSLPSNLGLLENTESTATINWENGGSGISNIQYGVLGFDLGEGEFLNNQTDDFELIEDVESDLLYAFYVQDSCESGNSPWVGPFIFTAAQCEEPADIVIDPITDNSATINWDGMNGTDWTFSWGLEGFLVEFGVMTTATEIPYTLDGLTPETAYQFYLRSNCTFDESNWVGPFDFSTLELDDTGIEEGEFSFEVYPNPVNEILYIKDAPADGIWMLTNAQGKVLTTGEVSGNSKIEIAFDEFENGVYFIQMIEAHKIVAKQIVKN